MESFNSTFKRNFTKRLKHFMILVDTCNYYSKPRNNSFNHGPRSNGSFLREIERFSDKINLKCFFFILYRDKHKFSKLKKLFSNILII